MAKFTVTYKYPEWTTDVEEAKEEVPAGDVERMIDKFGIGEYIFLEFDTVEGTCTPVYGTATLEDDSYYEELNREWRVERGEEEEEDDDEVISSPVHSSSNSHTVLHIPSKEKPQYEGESVQHIRLDRKVLKAIFSTE